MASRAVKSAFGSASGRRRSSDLSRSAPAIRTSNNLYIVSARRNSPRARAVGHRTLGDRESGRDSVGVAEVEQHALGRETGHLSGLEVPAQECLAAGPPLPGLARHLPA